MTTKAKAFDCVEMKRKAQERLRREYEERKSEFASYADFINKKAEDSPLWKKMQAKIARADSTS